MLRRLLLVFAFALPAFAADAHPEWTTAIAPFRIADNLYYVGSRDLAAYLVVTPAGNMLINENLETSPAQIRAAVEKLGFKWSDTKLLLNSQAHFDHAAGAAEIRRETHAKLLVMDGDEATMETGGAKDFLAPVSHVTRFPPAHVDHVLHDGEVVTLGGVSLVAHKTAGHTRGCTTWSMRVHLPGEPANTLRNVVIVGGVTFWGDFQFVASRERPASYPGIRQDFARTFTTLRALPCDVFLGAHGSYFDMLEKLKREPTEGSKVWIDPQGYAGMIALQERKFNDEVKREDAVATRETSLPAAPGDAHRGRP